MISWWAYLTDSFHGGNSQLNKQTNLGSTRMSEEQPGKKEELSSSMGGESTIKKYARSQMK